MGVIKCEHIISVNSRGTRWFSQNLQQVQGIARQNFSIFLGDLPPEQIFYRNIPLDFAAEGNARGYGKEDRGETTGRFCVQDGG